MRVAWVAILLLLAGCAAPGPDAPPTPNPRQEALDAVALEAPTFRAPVSLGWAGRSGEPAITVAPDGTVYVAAAPQLWRSDDGRSFAALGERVCAFSVGGACAPGYEVIVAPLDGFGGGDAEIETDANGMLYFLGLDGESGSVPFQASHDRGETWSEPFDLAAGNASDRQWMLVLPNGTVYATWRDFGDPDAQDPPAQLLFRRSGDGGATWDPPRVIGPDTLIQGPLAYDATTRAIYTAVYDGGIRMLRSTDEGLTWSAHDVAPETRDTTLRDGRPIDMFPIAAVDDAGVVYLVWAADDASAPAGSKDASMPRVWLAASADQGGTWTAPRALSPEGKVAAFPWIVAGKPGRVAVAWYEGRAGTPSQTAPDLWDVALMETADAGAPDPTFLGGIANEAPTHVGGMCRSGGGCMQVECVLPTLCLGQDRSRSELFEMALRDGHPIVTWIADAQPPMTGIEVHVGGVESGTALR